MSDLIISENLIPAKDQLSKLFTIEGVDPILKAIKEEVDKFQPDLSTDKSRKEIASIAYKVSTSKTFLDNLGKDLVADMKAQVKVVDDSRKKIRDTLDTLRDHVRFPLSDWEKKEADKRKIADSNKAIIESYIYMRPSTSAETSATIQSLKDVVLNQETKDIYPMIEQVIETALNSLHAHLASVMQIEAERKELARLRDEKEKMEKEAELARAKIKELEDSERKKREEQEEAELMAQIQGPLDIVPSEIISEPFHLPDSIPDSIPESDQICRPWPESIDVVDLKEFLEGWDDLTNINDKDFMEALSGELGIRIVQEGV